MKFLRRAAVVAACGAVLIALPASAVAAPSWAVPRSLALPADATGIPDGFFSSLSCPAAHRCAASGSYSDSRGRVLGLVADDAGGHWGRAVSLSVPTNAGINPDVTLYGVSCGAVGNCAAVGSYQDAKGDTLAYLDTERAGHWRHASELALPPNALAKGQDAYLRSVSCSAANTCSAVGVYQDNSATASRTEGFVAIERHGTWSRAREVLLPASNLDPFVAMSQIACSSSANCVGVGSFINANDVTEALVVDEVNGAWHRAQALSLPSNASPFSGAGASEVTCLDDGPCTIFGTYLATGGETEGLSASETSGVWSGASELTMPDNAASNPHVFVFGFASISCSSPGNCSVGGQYRDATGAYQGFLENEVSGAWQPATEMLLPSGGTQSGANGGVVAVDCLGEGACVASGSYLASNGQYQADIITEASGVWQRATEVSLPAGAATVGVDGGIYAIHCASPTACVGIGSYLQSADTYEGFTLGA